MRCAECNRGFMRCDKRCALCDEGFMHEAHCAVRGARARCTPCDKGLPGRYALGEVRDVVLISTTHSAHGCSTPGQIQGPQKDPEMDAGAHLVVNSSKDPEVLSGADPRAAVTNPEKANLPANPRVDPGLSWGRSRGDRLQGDVAVPPWSYSFVDPGADPGADPGPDLGADPVVDLQGIHEQLQGKIHQLMVQGSMGWSRRRHRHRHKGTQWGPFLLDPLGNSVLICAPHMRTRTLTHDSELTW